VPIRTLLLFATSASFDFVNVTSDVVYVIALPFAPIATTYLTSIPRRGRTYGERRPRRPTFGA
jgi:hypothetical protein